MEISVGETAVTKGEAVLSAYKTPGGCDGVTLLFTLVDSEDTRDRTGLRVKRKA